MVENTSTRPSAMAFVRQAALLLCLLAPSVWMIATIPPLWRDVDAYNQVTRDPRISTFWGHAPAYCYLAKVPLFLGERWELSRGIALTPPESGQIQLTDTGVWLLIVAQHLALFGASIYFIYAIARSFWIRLGVALIWTSNALFYTFAHCVGSETLGVILLIVIAVKGLRLIRNRSEPSWLDWYGFAIVLWLCLLARLVNVMLVFLLPAAFLLSAVESRTASWFATSSRIKRWLRALGTRHLRHALVAVAVGIACAVVANSVTQSLARKTRLRPHSRMGYTFLWRLQFLKTLPAEARVALLEKVRARASSTEARQLVTLLGQMHAEGADPTAGAFQKRAIPLLFPGEAFVPWDKLDAALNQMARAFLLPPASEHLEAARTDFASALKMSVTEIEDMLFETTGYFFDNKLEMPGCAELVTFRNASVETINALPSQHSYFHFWHPFTLIKTLVIWFGSLLVYLFVARRKKVKGGAVCPFAISLVVIGLLTLASACVLTEFLPRYATPMWQLLLLSLYIFIAQAGDLIAKGSPPGSHCRAEP